MGNLTLLDDQPSHMPPIHFVPQTLLLVIHHYKDITLNRAHKKLPLILTAYVFIHFSARLDISIHSVV